MTIVLIVTLFVLGLSSLMPSTARIEYDIIENKQIKRYNIAGNGSKLCFYDILCVFNDIDTTPATKISPWNNIRKRDWLSDIVTLLDVVAGHNLYALIDDILNYKINNKSIFESLSAITKYESVLNKLKQYTVEVV